jgi:Prokaryotic cytochrome b561
MIHKIKSTRSVLLGTWHKRTLYTATALLWLTGVLWLWQPLVPLWMKIHGAAAMGFLMVFGALLLRHVPLGWQQERQRPSGVWLIVLSAALIVTGWGLYYAVDRQVRDWTGKIHWIIGLAFPAIIALHIVLGRYSSERP